MTEGETHFLHDLDVVDISDGDYGRGYATVLRQALNHRGALEVRTLTTSPRHSAYAQVDGFDYTFGDRSLVVSTWFSGCLDHLQGIRQPKAISSEEWQRAVTVVKQAGALTYGYAARASYEDAVLWLDEIRALLAQLEMPTATMDECMDTDRALGLEPSLGVVNCPYDLWNLRTRLVVTHEQRSRGR